MRAPTIGRAKHVIERQRDGRVSRTPRAVHNEAAHSPGGVGFRPTRVGSDISLSRCLMDIELPLLSA